MITLFESSLFFLNCMSFWFSSPALARACALGGWSRRSVDPVKCEHLRFVSPSFSCCRFPAVWHTTSVSSHAPVSCDLSAVCVAEFSESIRSAITLSLSKLHLHVCQWVIDRCCEDGALFLTPSQIKSVSVLCNIKDRAAKQTRREGDGNLGRGWGS